MEQLRIGKKIKLLRKQKALSILQLSEISGVSTGLISQIERDLVVPTVVSLWNIAKALDTHISFFFEEEKSDDPFIRRKGHHKTIVTNKGNGFYQLLSPDGKDHMIDFTRITLKGGQTFENHQLTHEGEECGFVLSGILTVSLNDTLYELYEGDSIYFKSTQPHAYLNLSDKDCISIWAMTPLFF